MLIDVSKIVVGTSTTDEWKKGDYSSGPDHLVLSTDHIVHMEDGIKMRTSPTTVVTLSDGRVVFLATSLQGFKNTYHIP